MKYLSLSLLLLVLALTIAFNQPATPAPLDAAVSNAFLDLLVNDAGSPALRTTGGSSATPADDDEPLLFGANTSFTSVWIDGAATSLRDTAPTAGPTADGDAITTTWTVGEVEVTQTHALATNPYTGRPDTMRVTTTLRNTGAAEHEAGLPVRSTQTGVRVLLDVLVGGSDVATLLIPGDGVVTTEKDYQATLPLFYRFFGEAGGEPDAVQALGLLAAPGTTPPDRFVVGRWSELDATVWDYTITPDAALDDSAVAMWWEPASLAPGTTRSVTTFYGLADWTTADAWFDAPAGLTCEGRGEASRIDGSSGNQPALRLASPLRFTTTLWVRNRGETAWTGGEATLTLPAGLALADGESATQTLGDVPAEDARSVTWRLVADEVGDWTYSAQVAFTEGDSLTAEGMVSVPACEATPTPTTTTTPTATVTATVTLTPTPTGTPGAGEEWEVYLPLLRRDPRPLPDLTGTGGTSIVLRRVPPSGCVFGTSISVWNQGTGPAGPFVVRGDSQRGISPEWRVEGLAAGEQRRLDREWYVTRWAKADADDEVAESNETNNEFLLPIATAPADCTPVPPPSPTPTSTTRP